MLSLNSFIFCQKDIGELTNFFLADKTAAVSAKLKAARVATLSAPLQFHEKKNFFLFLTFLQLIFQDILNCFLENFGSVSRPDKS